MPHLPASEFSFMRGAFLSVDRPYGKVRHSSAFPYYLITVQYMFLKPFLPLIKFLNRVDPVSLVIRSSTGFTTVSDRRTWRITSIAPYPTTTHERYAR